ncbi:MAG: SDR family NAD(P)-dependent oxidoreductase [Rhodospirillaceae bacterium]|nr:SDR family NAD(P)-dependent oxidoreductase [Rhodospirillaceae bacterium]
MEEFGGRAAIVTGAASGIGYAIADQLVRAGARVALVDIDRDGLDHARRSLAGKGGDVIAIEADVSDRTAVANAALAAERAFGPVHLAINNAGIILPAMPLESVPPRDWDWILSVNLLGVVHGIAAFLPLLRRHGEPTHFVNTASILGLHLNGESPTAAYSATKYAVVALSEGLRNELAGTKVGVSVLCPDGTATCIWQAERRRPSRFGGPAARPPDHALAQTLMSGWSADRVARRLLDAIRAGEFYVFARPDARQWVAQRHREIEAAFERAAAWAARHPQ